MNATVVIVTYNRLDLLKECLSCVNRQSVQFEHIVIVDNKSTDGTISYLESLLNKYHVIFEKENGGGAKGFHDGVKYVYENLKTDWILLIDDDAMLEPNYLREMNNASLIYRSVQAFSGSVMTNGVIDLSHRKYLKSDNEYCITPIPIEKYSHDYFEYDFCSFCGLFFSFSLIEKIGYPQKEYFIWYDDTEYSLRIRQKTKIINNNKTFINHKTKLSNGSTKLNWRGYYGVRNSGDVIKRYGTVGQFKKFVRRIRLAQYKQYAIYLITRKKKYLYNYSLYKDALNDLFNERFGFNPKYHA